MYTAIYSIEKFTFYVFKILCSVRYPFIFYLIFKILNISFSWIKICSEKLYFSETVLHLCTYTVHCTNSVAFMYMYSSLYKQCCIYVHVQFTVQTVLHLCK